MRWTVCIGLVGALGCAPPPPSISIAYPPQGAQLPLNPDGSFFTIVVVDVDGFVVGQPDDTDPTPDGHWHLQLNGEPYARVFDLHGEVDLEPGVFEVDNLYTFRAFLVDNGHQPLGIEELLEFTVVAHDSTTDDTGTTGTTGT